MIANTKTQFAKYTSEDNFAKIVDYACITEMWEHCATAYENAPCLQQGEEKVTYGELNSAVATFRKVLQDNGVSTGDRVGVYAPNSIDFAKAYLAITTLGAVAVLLPPHLDKMTVFGCSMKFALKALVYAPALAENLEILKAKNPALPTVETTAQADGAAPSVTVDGKAPCTVLFTGGTTGRSKGALLSNQAVMRGVKNGCYGIKEIFAQRYFLVLPLTHVFGLIRNLLTSFYTGSALYFCSNPKNMFKEIPVFRPTIFVLVPALAELGLNLSKQFGRNMLGENAKTIICGAAFVPPYLVKEYSALGIALLPGYGLTESANLVSGNPEAIAKPDSVGIIYPDIEYKVVENELWLKGINMLDSYFGEPEENAVAFEDGWFKTGDLVRIDEDGFLYITGRKKEVIVLPSGENVSPAEIENKFYAVDAVQDCLVYEKDGVLVLEVLPRMASVKAQGIADLEGYLKERVAEINATLPSFARINKLIIRETDFVRSPAMKIVRGQN